MSHDSQKWGLPLLTLSAYLRFWSFICLAVTLWLVFIEKEVSDRDIGLSHSLLTCW